MRLTVKNGCPVLRGCGTVVYAILLGLVLLAPPVLAQSKPKEFPEVALSAGSQPCYVALAMDPWKSRVAYLLFDGSLDAGYARVYLWIPDDPRFSSPVALPSTGDGQFGPFDVRIEHGEDISRVGWVVAAQKRTAGGTHQQYDYATGKSTSVTTEQRDYVEFGGTVSLARGSRLDMVGETDYPLDITMGCGLGTTADWNSMGGPTAPWENLEYRVNPRAEAAGEAGLVLMTGVLNAKVRALPEEAVVEVKVRPYLEDPVSTTTYGVDALARGVSVPVPYGWYTVSWSLDCDLLTGRMTGTTGVFPVSKPSIP